MLSTGLVELALMAVYWAWVSSQEPYDVSAACADVLGESPEDRDFRLSLELETAFFPPSVTCAAGADEAELIEPRAVAAWTVVELAGLTLTSTGTVLFIAGVLRETPQIDREHAGSMTPVRAPRAAGRRVGRRPELHDPGQGSCRRRAGST